MRYKSYGRKSRRRGGRSRGRSNGSYLVSRGGIRL